ncbi:hypothetical protein [Neobacillus citreus]|uniref:Uncharacterized protein n=1 Tax=Neobacillus citreus TaxID=2833578 RepID=A0A942T185_9BACI|nr:hypothetical protein [Neobacillus citreus]MCH6267634.1 hypothetical protein [Neobacillus citreus]
MKSIHLILSLALEVVALTGCSLVGKKVEPEPKQEVTKVEKKEVSATEEKVEDKEIIEFEGISFKLPKNSAVIPLEKQLLPTKAFFLDRSHLANLNIVVESLAKPMKLDQYIEVVTRSTGYNYISKQNYSNGEIQWNESISLNQVSGKNIKLNQRTFIYNNKAYIFTYGASEGNYDLYLKLYEEITNSVVSLAKLKTI